jgi:uncharacterized protein
MHRSRELLDLTRDARDLARLIDVYESNFVRLERLIPELDLIRGNVVSSVAGATDLYLSVYERTRYTTTIGLTYRFDDGTNVLLEPHARIRIYHDVRAAELLSHTRRRRSAQVRPWRPGRRPELDRKWDMNRFLQKWLGFCHRQGHLFLAVTARPVAAELLEPV